MQEEKYNKKEEKLDCYSLLLAFLSFYRDCQQSPRGKQWFKN
ncbi:hypothetical protein HNR34_000238 [Geobacillus subterraneus]